MSAFRKVPLYADFNAKAKDFFSKEFPDKAKAEGKLKPSKNLSTTVSMTRNGDGSLVGLFTPKLLLPANSQVSVELSTDPAKLAKGSATITPGHYLPGLKMVVEGETGNVPFATLEYKHNMFTVTTKYTWTTALSAALAAGYKGWVVGGKAEYGIPKKHLKESSPKRELREAEIQFGYGAGPWELTAYVTDKGKICGGSYYHEISKLLTVCVDGSFDISARHREENFPKLEVGASLAIDPDTTIKAKLATDCRLGLSFSQRLSKYARLILSASANTANLGPSGNHKFGASLLISDE